MTEQVDKRIIVGIVIFLILIALGGIFLLLSKKEEAKNNENAIKFKEEYESLNGTENAGGIAYPSVELNEANPFVYIDELEAVKLLENGTGLIYFGFNTCPWCRSLVPNLVIAADSTNLGTIHYLDIKDIRSSMGYEDGKIVTSKKGSDSYYKMLDLLEAYLTPYEVIDEKEKSHSTGENRLYAPTLVAVVEGEIVGFHEGTLKEHTNGYQELVSEQIEELNQILVSLISKISDSLCEEKC